MKTRFPAACALLLLLTANASAAPEKYQVTGPITAMDDATITVVKGGKEKFVMARSAATKVSGGEPKVGEKVTVQYTITATDIEVKADKPAAGAKAAKADKPAAAAPKAPAPAPVPAGAGAR